MNRQSILLLIAFAVSFFVYDSSRAQVSKNGEILGTPWAGEPGIRVSVSDIMKSEKARVPSAVFLHTPHEEFEVDRSHLKQNPFAPAVSSWPPIPAGKQPELTNSLLSPQTVGTSFLATDYTEGPGYVPPDVMGDVGPTQILVHVNGRIKVFDKGGNLGALNSDDNVFWNSVRSAQLVSDPHVRYDPISKRWFLCIINTPATGRNRILIAVSSDSIITGSGSFTFFQFLQDAPTPVGSDNNGFADYPTLGVDANALYIGTNIFNSTGTAFIGCTAFVIKKSSLLTGTLTVTVFRDICTNGGAGPYTPQGVQNDDPASTEGYFIGIDNLNFGQLDVRRVSTPGGTPTMSGNLVIAVPTTTAPINQVAKGSTAALDALEDRLFAAQLKKNKRTGVTSLWTAHNIEVNSSGVGTAGGGRNGSRWYEVTNLTGTPTLRQSGTVFSSAASNPTGYWIPSVAMSGQGHMALGCSYASTNDYSSIGVAGRFSGDVLGTTQSVTSALVGGFAYNIQSTTPQRWGDYTQTVVDPTDDMTLWTFQEYASATDVWGIRVLKLIAPPPATPSSSSPSSVNTNLTTNITITGTSFSGSQFFDPGAGYTNRISATVNGGGVTVNSITFTDSVHVTLNITVANGATSGARTVTVTNPDGQSATSSTGILTINNISCPTITLSPATLTNGAAGSSYSQSITASGGLAAYTYAVTAGALPAGMNLSPGGLLSGTPTFGGSYSFSITATDANSCTGTQAYSWTVTGCPQITLSPLTLPGGIVGASYSQTVTASGGTPSYTYSVTSGSLPAGVTLSSGGALSGSPTTATTYNFTITATDANTCTGSQAYSVTISNCPAITLSPSSLPNGTAGTAYSQTITSSGGTASYTYAVTSGTLPAGLSLSSGGALTGTPPTAGTSPFTVTSTDANTCTGSQAYSLTIDPNGSTISLTTSGVAYTQNFNSLASTGTTSNTVPAGWALKETGTSADTTYGIGTGSSPTGNTYSFGSTSAPDRAFGGLQSGNVNPTIGANFTNNTGGTISSLAISYTGEEWRVGANRATRDSILFALSTDATSLSTGTWTLYASLDFASRLVSTAISAVDGNASANRAAISGSISGLSIANGASFYIRWTDFNITGADDGLAVDDFSLTPTAAVSSTNPSVVAAASPASVTAGTPTLLTATVTGGTNPASSGVGVAVNLTSVGGSSTQTMYDDGSHGDAIASNNVFSFRDTIPLNTATGSKILRMTVSDLQARSGIDSATISVTCPTISLSPASAPNGTVGSFYTQTITASGGTAPYNFTVTGGALPSGILLATNGTLSGTSSAAVSSSFTVTATDFNGCTGNRLYTPQFTCPVIAISPASLADDSIGKAYSQVISASGGTAPYTFTVTAGSPPAGISLAPNGTLSGTPGSSATATFTVTATDTFGCTGAKQYSIQSAACPSITLSPSALPAGNVGAAYNQVITASGGKSPYTYAVTGGALPAGFTLSSGGTLSGTATSADTAIFTVTASDSDGCMGSKVDTLVFTCPAIAVGPAVLPGDTLSKAFSQALNASGGTSPYTFTVTSGVLPSGLNLSLAGLLLGTATTVDTFSFTVTATDTFGCPGARAYTIIVADTVTIPPDTAVTISVPLASRWNIISNPVTTVNDSADVLFPGAISPMYTYTSTGYQTRKVLQHGSGYWLKFSTPRSANLHGLPRFGDTVAVTPGWNLVGSLSGPVSAGDAKQNNPIVGSNFFGYGTGYFTADTLKPGKGYWVKTTSAGSLILTAPHPAAPAHTRAIKTVPKLKK